MRDGKPSRGSLRKLYIAAGVVLAVDQLTKLVARSSLEYDRPIAVIPGLFDLRLTYNPGAAFGALPDWAPLFIMVALVAVFAIVRLGRVKAGSRTFSLGLGLLLGGALGNLVDRLATPSREVTDFLSFHVRFRGEVHSWPTFNLADAAIVVGVVIVLHHVYFIEKREAN